MTRQEYLEDAKRQCRMEWFKNHVAKCQATGDIGGLVWSNAAVIEWQNPTSWNYGCRFIIHRQWLIVVGDIGEAVYQWGADISMGFLASLDFGYFRGKCQSSESGKKFEMWDYEVAATNCARRLADLKADETSAHSEFEIELLTNLGKSSVGDYKAAAQQYYDKTGDGDGAGLIAEMGIVPNNRCVGHFVGIQMAIQQLLEANAPKPAEPATA